MNTAERKVKIQYLYHSGFLVETEQHILIFDYMEGQVEFSAKRSLVFASHAHSDHFNPAIFQWLSRKPDIQYILSNDIPRNILHGIPNSNVTFLGAYEEITVGDVTIKTFGSTDEGVSFLVHCDGLTLFHAGDLNWWSWWQDTAENIALAEKQFKEEIARLKGEQIDLAFFPVDQRLEHHYSLGADYFIRELAPQYLIPMHFGDHLETSKRYAEKAGNGPSKIVAFNELGREISLALGE